MKVERMAILRHPLSDPRLPLPGTRLVREIGNIRCVCVVESDGIRYGKRRYRSLSGAASAAARDCGLNPSQNGYSFWGLAEQGGISLEARFERYRAALRNSLHGRGAEGARRDGLRHLDLLRRELLNRDE